MCTSRRKELYDTVQFTERGASVERLELHSSDAAIVEAVLLPLHTQGPCSLEYL